jgi:hypothetical protein
MGTIIPAPGSIPARQHAAHGGRITLTHADTARDDRIGGSRGATTWWQDGTTSYVLHFRSGQVHGWTMADEADTAIQALDSLRAGEDMSGERLWAALRDVRRLRNRLEALEAELILRSREGGQDGRALMSLREIGEATDLHHTTVAERVERMHAGEHAAWRHWLTQGTPLEDMYTGTPCASCGHPFTHKDTPVAVDGYRIHTSHTNDPASGFYQPDASTGLDETKCTCTAPPGYGSHDPACGVYGDNGEQA